LSKLAASHDRVGRRIDPRRLPAATAMLALCVLVFGGQLLASMARGITPSFLGVSQLGEQIDAIRFGGLIASPQLVAIEPWRLLSAAFVHYGILHVGMNMLALTQLSRVAEPAVGSARFTIAYTASAVVSFGTTTVVSMLTSGPPPITAGASGAVFGVMGLILGVLVRRRDPRWKGFAVQAVIFSVAIGFVINASGTGIMINNSAHLGGLATGFALGWLFATSKRPRRRLPGQRRPDLWVNVAAVACFVACLASLGMAQQSRLWRELEKSWLSQNDSTPVLRQSGLSGEPACAIFSPGGSG